MKLTKKEMKQIKGGLAVDSKCQDPLPCGTCWDGTPIYCSEPIGKFPFCNYQARTICPPQS